MSATIREIVNQALTVVGEASGPGVQVYEDDRMKADAIRAFNMMFKKYPWQQYLHWFDVELDGLTGVTKTSPFEQVKDFEDFIAIHRSGYAERLPIAPTRLNPNTLGTSGTQVMYWTSMNATNPLYAKKKLQFYPFNSVGRIDVLAKIYPLKPGEIQFDWGDIFYLDTDMLVYATAFMTLSMDDLNAAAAEVARNLMEMKYKDIMAALGNHPIPVSAGYGVPTYWSEAV